MKPLLCIFTLAAALFFAGSGASADNSATVQLGSCSREVEGYGLVTGKGVLVVTPSGQIVSVCGISLDPRPGETTVSTYPGGNIIVIAAGGRLVSVFTPCGPSAPCQV